MSIQAILFDAYGTVLDIHSAVERHNDRLGVAAAGVSALWRTKQLEYTWTLTLAGDYRPFDVLTAEALDFALAQHQVVDPALRSDLLQSYRRLSPFPDVAPALTALRDKGLTIGILSNGSPDMLGDALAAGGIAPLFDPVLSVDALRLYKPHPDVYAMARRHLNLPTEAIGFVSSNAWDAMGASRFGFRVFQLRRQDSPREYGLQGKAKSLTSLAELPAAI
ncbi:MAG: haloacid dehalogenase type II [Proteobacteria bacterium]|nr:haloacid dehalogenase type II [Pseudomonadota bacterium]